MFWLISLAAAAETLSQDISEVSTSEASKFNTRDKNEQNVNDVKAGRETTKGEES